MREFFLLIACVGLGSIFSLLFFSLPVPSWLLLSLLAIGLYGATSGIDIASLKNTKFAILFAITKGVLFKAIFIGGILYIFFQDIALSSLGIILAQIDPISTARLTQNEKSLLSVKGKSFINTLASFDDPMTFLLAFYVMTPFLLGQSFGMEEYGLRIFFNIGFAGIFYILFRLFQKWNMAMWGLLAFAFGIAISFELMLGIALIGLFLRPKSLEKISSFSVNFAYFFALFIMGTLLVLSEKIFFLGILAGISAFFSHFLLILFLEKTKILKFSASDICHLKWAHYNGITASLLALHFASFSQDLIGITIVAMVVIAFLYHFSNNFFLHSPSSTL